MKYESRADERKHSLAHEKKETAAQEKAEHVRDISQHQIQGTRPDVSAHKIQETLLPVERMHEEMKKGVI